MVYQLWDSLDTEGVRLYWLAHVVLDPNLNCLLWGHNQSQILD